MGESTFKDKGQSGFLNPKMTEFWSEFLNTGYRPRNMVSLVTIYLVLANEHRAWLLQNQNPERSLQTENRALTLEATSDGRNFMLRYPCFAFSILFFLTALKSSYHYFSFECIRKFGLGILRTDNVFKVTQLVQWDRVRSGWYDVRNGIRSSTQVRLNSELAILTTL